MPLRKTLRTTWHNALSLVSSTQDSNGNTSPLPGQSEPTTSPPLQASSSEERVQITNQPLASQMPASREGQGHPPEVGSPGFFTGLHNFVLNRPIIGVNQRLHLHYEGTQQPSSQQPHASAREGTQTNLSRNPLNQGHPVAREVTGLSGEGGNHTFVGQTQNVNIQNHPGKPNVLRELKEYTISGAAFNSAERDPPPRCHPGTRTSIRKELGACLKNPNQKARIIWIHGTAGVGKSAIMQTVVEEVEPHVIFATLFFSRPNRRHDARKAFTTLAYGLAVASPEYRRYIGTKMEDDPTCLTKSLEEQFKMLFVIPFVKKHVPMGSRRWAVFLDGLDECENTKGSDNQSRIMNLICDSILHHGTSTPFIWVIASRPEGNLKKAWSQIQHRFRGKSSNLLELEIPVDSDQATKDVELYLHSEFETIRTNYSELMPGQSRWPSDGHFVKVAKKSSGLFVFASTVIKYVSDEDPVARLEFVVSLIDQAEQNTTTDDENPFHMVDLLYSSIMSDIPKRLLPTAISLLGVYLLSESLIVQPRKNGLKVSLMEACNILGLRQNEAYAALRKLQSVLICPPPEKAQDKGIQFFHASFPDFLLEHSRSREFQVNLEQELNKIWPCYTRIIRQSATQEGYTGVETSWPPYNSASVLSLLQRELLWQAQNGWITIVMNYSCNVTAPRRLHVDVVELVEAFQSFGLAFLAVGYFPLEEFLLWLQYAPSGIQEAIVSQRFVLRQLDTERLFKSLCARPQYRYAMGSHVQEVDLAEFVRGLQWAQVKEKYWTSQGKFRELVEAFNGPNIRVTVIGTEPSESCVVIGPISKARAFYILPYVAS